MDVAPDGATPERASFREVILKDRLHAALHRLDPQIAAAGLKDAMDVLVHGGTPGLITGNETFIAT